MSLEPKKKMIECESFEELLHHFPNLLNELEATKNEMPDVIGSDAHRAWFHRKYGENADYSDWSGWLFDANKDQFTEMGLKRPEP